eukprot:TRINITY_DN1819_c0_g3_i1.p1 TRINITY_DN1819_c0_g3~~TRINITY_DN1819_c0_g3_i1.p1  ORF type:complete len:519 (+),score=217.84 TRINITY_DN1819_c0_g3_i1:53-1609(+)
MMLHSAVAALALAAPFTGTPPQRHEVTHLPGYDEPLASRMWTGYVDAGTPPSGKGTAYFHYFAFEAEANPETAPVVFWYNGGPGASSLFGLFQELGPNYLNSWSMSTDAFKKTGIPTPMRNAKTWARAFNLIALDSPPPVGFSFCTEHGPSGGGTSCGPWKDTDVFKANHRAVTEIMKNVFPEWQKKDIFITGESYAGVYVPGLVNEFVKDPAGLNVKGLAVGDGCMGHDVVCVTLDVTEFKYPAEWPGPWYDVQFFGGHGQMSMELWMKILKNCPEEGLKTNNLTQACHDMVGEMGKQVGGFYRYDLFDDCSQHTLLQDGLHKNRARRRALLKQQQYGSLKGLGATTPTGHDYFCPGQSMNIYLNNTDVRRGLGIYEDSFFFNADNGHGFDYTCDVADVRPFYKNIADAGIRVLTYEGDADACGLSSYGLQDVYNAFWPTAGYDRTESWRAWTLDGQRMGGYVMEFGPNVAHLTVRGAGHLVPLNRPDQALSFITSFVNGEDFKKYTAPAQDEAGKH